jgi:hypothetical protein
MEFSDVLATACGTGDIEVFSFSRATLACINSIVFRATGF